MNLSSIDVTAPLFVFEKKHELFLKKTPDGIFYWTLVREKIQVVLWKNKGMISESEKIAYNPPSKWRMFKQLWDVLLNELNFIFRLKEKKAAFISLSRNIDSSQHPIDLMLQDYMILFKGDYNILEVYGAMNFKRSDNKYTDRYFISWMELKKRLFPYNDSKVSEDFSSLATLLTQELEVDYDWNQLIKQSIYEYRLGYQYYRRVFKRLNPKFLFYTFMIRPAIAAANDLGIETIEVLHGCPSPNTLAWRMADDASLKAINCSPKYLFTFSEYWHQFISNNFNTVNTGNDFFYSPALPEKKRTKTFTVISSIYTFQKVIEIAYKSAVLLKDHHFIIKLQSAEIDHIKVVKKMFEGLTNYSIVFNEYNVNQLFDRSDYVLLVQSSCTYQAIQKGLHVFVYKRLYFNDSEDVFDLPHVHLVEHEQDIQSVLERIDQEAAPEAVAYFFEKFNSAKVNKLLNGLQRKED